MGRRYATDVPTDSGSWQRVMDGFARRSSPGEAIGLRPRSRPGECGQGQGDWGGAVSKSHMTKLVGDLEDDVLKVALADPAPRF